MNDTTQLSGGLSERQRIDVCLSACLAAGNALDVQGWYLSLWSLFREVAYRLPEARRQEIITCLNELNTHVTRFIHSRGFSKGLIDPQLHAGLNKLDMMLRDVAGNVSERKEEAVPNG